MEKKIGWFFKSVAPETIDQRYRSVGGFTHGFDYLRLILAAAVVVQHSLRSSYGPAYADVTSWLGWHRAITAPILLMFFALSGFLVAGSLKRRPTATAFMTLRAMRLVPALAVEVLLSALILGPLLTELPWRAYFSAPEFFKYFQNIYGHIHFRLPGVFVDTPAQEVNISLWTVPYELECYLALLGLWLIGILKRRAFVVAITVAFIAVNTYIAFDTYTVQKTMIGGPARALVAAFLCGLCINLYSDRIKLTIPIAAAMLLGMVVSTLQYQTASVAAIFAAYMVVYLGMTHPPKKSFLLRGDYSYGLYLFAFPIQQTYTHLFPGYRHWYINAPFAIILGLMYAYFSWWCVEKPILDRKKQIVGFTENFASRLKLIFARQTA
ncbi:acyltransferase family protein [Xylophilus rhododendri]|nr:acyltransferase [Xylophilus rhododendri]